MTLKLLYTGCLLLCLSTIASSNECPRYCHQTAVKVAIPGVSTIPPSCHMAEATEETGSEESQNDAAPTLIKLLYI